jgi:hypothetical protein
MSAGEFGFKSSVRDRGRYSHTVPSDMLRRGRVELKPSTSPQICSSVLWIGRCT